MIRTVIRSVIVTDIQIGRTLMTVRTTTINQETANWLSTEFHHCFSEYEAGADLFAEDTGFVTAHVETQHSRAGDVADDRIWAEAPMVEGRS